jgi:hypothetical protein
MTVQAVTRRAPSGLRPAPGFGVEPADRSRPEAR